MLSVNAKDIENSWDNRDYDFERESEAYARDNELETYDIDHHVNTFDLAQKIRGIDLYDRNNLQMDDSETIPYIMSEEQQFAMERIGSDQYYLPGEMREGGMMWVSAKNIEDSWDPDYAV